MTALLRTIVFADEKFGNTLFRLVEILVCEISGRNDKTSSCNHDMDLVIGGIALML